MIDLTFVGHQTWLLSRQDTHVLLDPVLGPSFGHCPYVEFRVFPLREVRLEAMPRIDAVLLSHEHLDHFHLPSLFQLPREVPFYVGPLMPGAVTRALEALGFTVHRMPLGTPFRIKELELTLYAAGRDTVSWEQRVTQVYAAPAGTGEPGVFIGVDALISDNYRQQVGTGALPPPLAVVVANNSQVLPRGAIGAYSNLLPLPDRLDARFPGIELLNSLFIDSVRGLRGVRHVILCGNGTLDPSEAFGPYLFSDHQKLAELANQLALGGQAHGPSPGERLRVTKQGVESSQAEWIRLLREQNEELQACQRRFLEKKFPSSPFHSLSGAFDSPEAAQQALQRVEAELEPLARALLRSKVGQQALSLTHHLKGALGPRRILLRFYGWEDELHSYALDMVEGRFVRDDAPSHEALATYPFGLELHLKDFDSLLEGRLQVWDLGGNAMRSWFLGSFTENLVVFLYDCYGEQTRPDLAWKLYAACLERLKSTAGKRHREDSPPLVPSP